MSLLSDGVGGLHNMCGSWLLTAQRTPSAAAGQARSPRILGTSDISGCCSLSVWQHSGCRHLNSFRLTSVTLELRIDSSKSLHLLEFWGKCPQIRWWTAWRRSCRCPQIVNVQILSLPAADSSASFRTFARRKINFWPEESEWKAAHLQAIVWWSMP